MVASFVNSTLINLLASYKKWIVANPQLLSDIETTVRCLSYFSVGNFSNSSLISELIYSMPNLIVLLNDLLIYSSKCVNLKIPQFESRIKIWLTIVEYTETLFEISAKKLWGERGKWLIIAMIQIFKTVLRLLLIHVHKERVTKNPPITPLNREKLNKSIDTVQLKEGFTLKRTGAVVRDIKNTAPRGMRTWKALSCNTDENENLNNNQQSEKILKLAENLYVIKPLLHLACVSVTNQQQWQPWLVSLLIDIISLNMFNRCAQRILFSKEEKEEFLRRRMSLLLYILRSPFYDKYSRTRVYALLDMLSTSIPFARLLTDPLKKNLPYMQSMYFYMWSC